MYVQMKIASISNSDGVLCIHANTNQRPSIQGKRWIFLHGISTISDLSQSTIEKEVSLIQILQSAQPNIY